MNPSASPRDRAAWLAYGLPISYVGIYLAFHVMNVLLYADARVAAFIVSAAFFAVLSVEYLQPLARARAWICRPPLVLLTALTWLPLIWFRESWAVPLATFGGILLFRLRAPLSWWVFGAVVAVHWPLWFALAPGGFGERISLSSYFMFGAFASGLGFYGFGRLGGLVAAVRVTQDRLTEQAVLAERLRAARDLDGLLGTALTAIADRGRAALRAMDGAGLPDFRPVVQTARDALTKARALASGYRDRTASADEGGAEIRPQLALPILISVHAGNVLWHIATQPLRPDGLAGGRLVLFVALLIAILGLQVRHTVLRARLAGTVGAYATLAVQAALTGAALALRPMPMSFTLGFLVGSILLLVPARWSWPLSGVVVAGATSYVNIAGGLHGWELASFVGVVIHLTVLVYGLTTLNELAKRLQDARDELAAMAVLSERLRFARDVHDLHGLTFSAIILKGELVCRIAESEPERARRQIAEIVELAEAALAELRSGTGDSGLSLAVESASARRLLSAVGIQVRGRTRIVPPDAEADATLAVVLREAVTNVLRHSAARRVTLEIGPVGDKIRLRIANDGVPAAATPPGSGMANLTARVQAVGGRLSAVRSTGRFQLVAEVPAAGSQPPGLGRDADGVEPVAGPELGHGRREDIADRSA